jgi:hypothetical protein
VRVVKAKEAAWRRKEAQAAARRAGCAIYHVKCITREYTDVVFL